jgi:hypothetical protein
MHEPLHQGVQKAARASSNESLCGFSASWTALVNRAGGSASRAPALDRLPSVSANSTDRQSAMNDAEFALDAPGRLAVSLAGKR